MKAMNLILIMLAIIRSISCMMKGKLITMEVANKLCDFEKKIENFCTKHVILKKDFRIANIYQDSDETDDNIIVFNVEAMIGGENQKMNGGLGFSGLHFLTFQWNKKEWLETIDFINRNSNLNILEFDDTEFEEIKKSLNGEDNDFKNLQIWSIEGSPIIQYCHDVDMFTEYVWLKKIGDNWTAIGKQRTKIEIKNREKIGIDSMFSEFYLKVRFSENFDEGMHGKLFKLVLDDYRQKQEISYASVQIDPINISVTQLPFLKQSFTFKFNILDDAKNNFGIYFGKSIVNKDGTEIINNYAVNENLNTKLIIATDEQYQQIKAKISAALASAAASAPASAPADADVDAPANTARTGSFYVDAPAAHTAPAPTAPAPTAPALENLEVYQMDQNLPTLLQTSFYYYYFIKDKNTQESKMYYGWWTRDLKGRFIHVNPSCLTAAFGGLLYPDQSPKMTGFLHSLSGYTVVSSFKQNSKIQEYLHLKDGQNIHAPTLRWFKNQYEYYGMIIDNGKISLFTLFFDGNGQVLNTRLDNVVTWWNNPLKLDNEKNQLVRQSRGFLKYQDITMNSAVRMGLRYAHADIVDSFIKTKEGQYCLIQCISSFQRGFRSRMIIKDKRLYSEADMNRMIKRSQEQQRYRTLRQKNTAQKLKLMQKGFKARQEQEYGTLYAAFPPLKELNYPRKLAAG